MGRPSTPLDRFGAVEPVLDAQPDELELELEFELEELEL